MGDPRQWLGGRRSRQAILLLPALLLILLIQFPAAWLPAWLASTLAAALLLVYPGYLLLSMLTGQWRLGRAEVALAVAAGFGLWAVPATLVQVLSGSLDLFLAITAATSTLLAVAAALRVPVSFADGRQTGRRLRSAGWEQWAQELCFWGAVLIALGVFAHYASAWRPTDRWTYQGIVRAILDSNNMNPAGIPGFSSGAGRLELSPWLVMIASLQRLSAVPLPALYSLLLPGMLLFASLCSAYALGRQVLILKWAASLAVLLLVVYWLTDIAVPATAAWPWTERMLLRPDGGESTLGQWALLGRVIEDKFLLLFVLLPPVQAVLMRYLYRSGRGQFTLLLLMTAGAALVHPLGIVFVGFSMAALAPFVLLRRRQGTGKTKTDGDAGSQPASQIGAASATLGRRWRVGATGVALAVMAIPAWLLRQQLAERATAAVFVPRGEAAINGLREIGLWSSAASDRFYAVHPYLIGRSEMLVAAVLLAPGLLIVRGLRKPGVQFLTGMLGISALATFNPLVAPLLGSAITPNMLFRTYWMAVLPAMLVLALGVQTGVTLLRTRRASREAQRRWALVLLLAAAVLMPAMGTKVGAGLDLLDSIHANSLDADERGVLAYLRDRAAEGSIVLAPEWLGNELPGYVGKVYGLSFRGNSVQPMGTEAMRAFYSKDRLDVNRLQTLAQYGVDLVVVGTESATDQQLGQLVQVATPMYGNAQYRVYALAEDWENDPVGALLLQGGAALAAGDLATAAALGEQALAASPGNYTATQVQAIALAEQGRLDEALAALDGVAADERNAGWVIELRGEVYRRQATAVASRRAPASKVEAAWRAAWVADPSSLETARALVKLDAQTGGKLLTEEEEQQILEVFTAATEVGAYPEAEFPLSARQRQALWDLGEAAEMLGRPADAEAAYRSAFALARPGNTEGEVAAHLGEFLVRQGRVDEARQLYAWALAANQNSRALYAAMAGLAATQGDKAAAQAIWYEAAAANPLAAWPYIELAKIELRQRGEQVAGGETAASYLERALALNPTDAESYWLLAQAREGQDDPAALRAVWEQAVAANPKGAWAWLALADTLRRQGDYAALAQTLAAAIQALPPEMPLVAELGAQLEGVEAVLAAQGHAQAYLEEVGATAQGAGLVIVDRPLASGWRLVGYAAERAALLTGAETPLWVFWQAPDGADAAGRSEQGWQQLTETLWVQAVPAAANLVQDGGFEQSAAAGRVIGFTEGFAAAPGMRQAAVAERNGEQAGVAVLANSRVNPTSSYETESVAAAPHKVYLQAGAMRSDDGSGYLGLRWTKAGGAGAGDSYTTMGETSSAWRSASQIFDPPAEAAAVQTLLLNLAATGTVYFDDVLLLPLDRPGA